MNCTYNYNYTAKCKDLRWYNNYFGQNRGHRGIMTIVRYDQMTCIIIACVLQYNLC